MPPANSLVRSAAEKTRLIKAEAARLGFLLVGVSTPDPPPHLGVYRDWLAAGRHGEMHYLAAARALERRADPRAILPGCQSIVVLGMAYNPSRPPPLPASLPLGRVASYAWGEDYHEILPNRLQSLAAFCETLAEEPFACRWYTDTGPLLERELAQRAGLGWIGKNTCLINPRAGSYFLLAELLLNLELESDSPLASDHCGTCRRCIEACPTQCILPDRTLDARRCISYLTIEQKGPIAEELREQLGSWAFGCDICQEVCPWNVRFAQPVTEPAFSPGPGMLEFPGSAAIDLGEVLGFTPQEFNRRYRKSAIRRAKRRGLLRNAAVALGNQAGSLQAGHLDRQAVIALENALLQDSEPLVRGHAAWALGKTGAPARAALEAALQLEQDGWVLSEINKALARLEAAA